MVDRITREGARSGGQRLELNRVAPGTWSVIGSPGGYSVELHLSPGGAAIELDAHSQLALQRLRERETRDLAVVGIEPARAANGTRWVVPANPAGDETPSVLARALTEAFLLAVDIAEQGSADATVPTLSLGQLPDSHRQVGWITTPDLRVPLIVAERANPAGVDLSAVTASGVRRYPAPRGAYLWNQDGRALAYESVAVAKWTVGTEEPVVDAGDTYLRLTWPAPIAAVPTLESLTVTIEDRDGSAFVAASGEPKKPAALAPSVTPKPPPGGMTIDQFIETRLPPDDGTLEVLRHLITDAGGLGLEWELGRSSNSADGLGAYAMLRLPGLGAEGQIAFLWPASHRLDLRLERAWAQGRTFATPRESARANAFQVQVDLRSEPARIEALELLQVALEKVGPPTGGRT